MLHLGVLMGALASSTRVSEHVSERHLHNNTLIYVSAWLQNSSTERKRQNTHELKKKKKNVLGFVHAVAVAQRNARS